MPARKERQSRRACSVLLWGAGAYLVLQLTAGVLLDYCWPLVRFPSARARLRELAAQPVKPDIVFLGSSRFGALVPGEMEAVLGRLSPAGRPAAVFNASVPAGDPIGCEFMLRRLRDNGARPRLVVLEISPDALNQYNEWLGLHVRRQLRWHDAPAYCVDVWRSQQIGRWLGDRLNPVFYHREEMWRDMWALAQCLTTGGSTAPQRSPARTISQRDGGSAPPASEDLLRLPTAPVTPAAAENSRIAASRPLTWLRHYCIRGASARALERVLQLCQEQGTAVVLLGVPVSQSFRKWFTPDIDTQYHAFVDRITRQYGCAYADYRDRLPDNLFADCHHLNAEGGLYFSRLLTYELLALFCGSQLAGQDY